MANYINQLMVYVSGERKKISAADNIEIGGAFTAGGGFSGSGANLTSLPAGQLTGALPALDGSALTSLNASNISSGTLDDARLTNNVPLLNAGSNTFTGALSATTLSGNGSTITAIAAGNITTGTLDDARLSSNVTKYDDAAPHFTGAGKVQSDAGFYGDGSELTNLSVLNIVGNSGDYLSDGLLAPNILRKDAASNTLTGNLTVDGDLHVGGDIVSGGSVNVVLSDQFLDLNGNNLLGTPQPGGIAVNVLSTGTTFDIESFTAGGSGTDPYCVVDGDATALSSGDLVQISQSASANDGQYLVYSTNFNGSTGKTTVYLRGNAVSAHPASALPQLPFVHNQLTTATEAAKLTAITVGVMAVSGGALFGAGHTVISAGTWCYGYGSTAANFADNWISLEPAATPSLQTAYNASTGPVTIEMTAAKGGFTLKPALGETAGFTIEATAASDIRLPGYEFVIQAARVAFAAPEVSFEGAGLAAVADANSGVVGMGDVCYIDSYGKLQLADGESLTASEREVDGVAVATGDFMASVFGTRAKVNYVGSAPAVGDLVYLGGDGNKGKCQVAVPTAGRVTSLGKCVVAGSAGECTIVWKPDYIIDL